MRRICIVLAIVLGVFAAAVPMASAATEFGDSCAANGGAPEYTFVSLSAVGDPLPLTAPSSGVITQWKTNVALETPTAVSEVMTVLRPNGAQFTVVGQSTLATVVQGINTFPTRVPVQAGDHLGLAGSFAPLYCHTGGAGDAMGVVHSFLAPGATSPFESTAGYRVPVTAVIEPDADGDGYGDETQDKCPQSASTQGACPKVKLSLSKVVRKSSVKLLVSADNTAPVKVVGKVKAGGKTLTLKGGKKTVKPGKITAFKLTFPAQLKAALEELPASESLSLKIVLTAKSLAGKVTAKKLTVKLKGQG